MAKFNYPLDMLIYPERSRAYAFMSAGRWLMTVADEHGEAFVREASLEEIIEARLLDVAHLQTALQMTPPFNGDWLIMPQPATPLRAAIWRAQSLWTQMTAPQLRAYRAGDWNAN